MFMKMVVIASNNDFSSVHQKVFDVLVIIGV